MSFILLLLLLHNAFRQILILDKKSRKSATCLPNVFPLSAQCLPHFCLMSTQCLPNVCPMSAKCLICLPNVPKFYLMSFSVKSLISSKMFFYIYISDSTQSSSVPMFRQAWLLHSGELDTERNPALLS